MVNEFNGRTFECAFFIPSGPSYENISADQRACAVQGSVPGSTSVSGTAYVETAFSYDYSDRWRNYTIILAITIILCKSLSKKKGLEHKNTHTDFVTLSLTVIAHLVMSELVASERSKGEVLVFRRSKMQVNSKRHGGDEEAGSDTSHQGERFDSSDSEYLVHKQVSIFHWEGVNYEIQIKGECRTILDSVDGWIKPGTLTALMVSD